MSFKKRVIGGKGVVQAKKHLSSSRKLYNSTCTLRNVGSQSGFQRLLAEAFPGQLLCRPQRAPVPLHECQSPLALRLEHPELPLAELAALGDLSKATLAGRLRRIEALAADD